MDDKKQILSIDDIKRLVDTFYEKVRQDKLIGPIFDERIQDRWPQHLEKMYRFWQTVLLEEHTYFGSPFAPHAHLPVEWNHFERWIDLFNENIDTQFSGHIAEEAKWRAKKMAEMFNYKIQFYKDNSAKPIL